MCISSTTRRITSTGQGDPAMIPVRSELRSKVAKSDRASSAMNMVGTPYSEVQRSRSTAARVATGSKVAAGMTTQAPWLVAARLPITMPKQW
ncbi:hypothetical protein SANTM175S_11065 [Streptomyces antimycoticus]